VRFLQGATYSLYSIFRVALSRAATAPRSYVTLTTRNSLEDALLIARSCLAPHIFSIASSYVAAYLRYSNYPQRPRGRSFNCAQLYSAAHLLNRAQLFSATHLLYREQLQRCISTSVTSPITAKGHSTACSYSATLYTLIPSPIKA
jgi:hypothetical protein